jgi:hypothetical protein
MKVKKITPGYYRLPSGKIIQVLYDGGNTIYAETETGVKANTTVEKFKGARPIEYKPSIPELWVLAKSIARKNKSWYEALHLFAKKLIEFEHIEIETLGYFYTEKEFNKKSIGESIAYKLAEQWSFVFPASNDTCKKLQKEFKDWAQNPTEKNRLRAFPATKRDLSIDRECPITGSSFNWKCDGKTIMPSTRRLERWEADLKRKELLKELKTLKKKQTQKKNVSAEELERIELLSNIEKPNGWIRVYHIMHETPAVPFADAYADPKTGKFPQLVVEIEVPSGKLVFANSLFKHLKDFDKEEEHATRNCVNHLRGRSNTSKFQARVNQAFYLHVGNTSPEVWQSKKDPGTIRVGRASEEAEKGQWSYRNAIQNWKKCGFICTDLWAFHAVDRTRLPKKIPCDHFIVTVPPGKYRLTSHMETPDGRKNGVFCDIQKI